MTVERAIAQIAESSTGVRSIDITRLNFFLDKSVFLCTLNGDEVHAMVDAKFSGHVPLVLSLPLALGIEPRKVIQRISEPLDLMRSKFDAVSLPTLSPGLGGRRGFLGLVPIVLRAEAPVGGEGLR